MFYSCGRTEKNSSDIQADTSHKVSKIYVSNDRLIVPSQNIGKINIDENTEYAISSLGKPDTENAAMGKSLLTWKSKPDTSLFVTQLYSERQLGTADDTSRIKLIRITSPIFQTEKNVRVGSNLNKIESSYQVEKVAVYASGRQQIFVYDDTNNGIAFETDANNICTGIIVHFHGNKVTTRLRVFHPNIQILVK
jgi:hypothetical protein